VQRVDRHAARNHLVAGLADSGDGITDPGNRTHAGRIREDVINAHAGKVRSVRLSWRIAGTIRDAQIREDVINADP